MERKGSLPSSGRKQFAENQHALELFFSDLNFNCKRDGLGRSQIDSVDLGCVLKFFGGLAALD